MPAGTVGTIKKVKVVGTKTVPRLVYAAVTFGSGFGLGIEDGDGIVTVNATDLEASKILAVLGGTAWNTESVSGTPHTGLYVVCRSPAYSDAGVTSVVLMLLDEGGTYGTGGETATVLFAVE